MSSAYFGDDDPVTETKTKETLKRKKTQGMYQYFIIIRKIHVLKISKRNTQTTTTRDFLGSTRRNGHGNVLRKMRMVV